MYRQHCKFNQFGCIKDLSILGRLLSRVILVDNLKENFSRQPRNGIEIFSWVGDGWDKELDLLGQQLANLFGKGQGSKDVRNEISKIKLKHND